MFRRKNLAALAPTLLALIAALPASAEDGPAIVVTATRQAQRANELINDVTVVERETIELMGSGSIVDLLSRQPGIQMMQNGGPGTSAQLFVRGTRSDQTKIIIDGVPINSMDLTGSPLRLIPLDQVDRVEIVRGPVSTLYGADAIGGVIQVFTRRNREGSGGDTYAGLGTNHSQRIAGSLFTGDDRLRLGLAANDYRIRSLSTVRDATKADADLDAYRNTGFNAYMNLTPAPGHEIAATWLRSRGQTSFDTSTGTGTWDNRLYFFNEVWSLSGRSEINPLWTSSLRYGQSVDDQSNYSSSLTPSVLITEGRQLAWQNDVKLPLGTGLVLIERQEQKAAPANRFPTRSTASNDALALGWTGYWQGHRWQWSNRQSRDSAFGGNSTWAAGYGYQIDKSWRINVSAGKSYKAPTMYQLYATITGSLVANPGLQPEQGHSHELGLTWDNGVWTAAATRYRMRIDNMIDYVTARTRYENISRALLDGWTLALNGRIADWQLGATLDQLDARNAATGKALERRAAQKLNLSAGKAWGAWYTGAEAIYVGPRYNNGTNETQTMGGYTLVNLVARYAFTSALSLELRGDNLTNKHYATALITNGNKEFSTPGASLFAGLRYSFQ